MKYFGGRIAWGWLALVVALGMISSPAVLGQAADGDVTPPMQLREDKEVKFLADWITRGEKRNAEDKATLDGLKNHKLIVRRGWVGDTREYISELITEVFAGQMTTKEMAKAIQQAAEASTGLAQELQRDVDDNVAALNDMRSQLNLLKRDPTTLTPEAIARRDYVRTNLNKAVALEERLQQQETIKDVLEVIQQLQPGVLNSLNAPTNSGGPRITRTGSASTGAGVGGVATERVWYVYTNGERLADGRLRPTVAKEPSSNFNIKLAGPMTWDEASQWLPTTSQEKVWYVYTDNDPTQKRYSVAKQPSGNFMFSAAGPMTWVEAWAWIAAAGGQSGDRLYYIWQNSLTGQFFTSKDPAQSQANPLIIPGQPFTLGNALEIVAALNAKLAASQSRSPDSPSRGGSGGGSATPPNPQPAPVYGSLTVVVSDASTKAPVGDATVSLGKVRRTGSNVVFPGIPRGRDYALNVSAPGYKPSASSVTINNSDQMIGISLTREMLSDGGGTVSVPSGKLVWVRQPAKKGAGMMSNDIAFNAVPKALSGYSDTGISYAAKDPNGTTFQSSVKWQEPPERIVQGQRVSLSMSATGKGYTHVTASYFLYPKETAKITQNQSGCSTADNRFSSRYEFVFDPPQTEKSVWIGVNSTSFRRDFMDLMCRRDQSYHVEWEYKPEGSAQGR